MRKNLESIDLFKPSVAELRYKGKTHYATMTGAIYSVFVVIVLICTILSSIVELSSNSLADPHILQNRLKTLDQLKSNSYTIGPNKALNIAFGFSEQHDSPEVVENPEFGTL
jgi:hypothetical protein